LRVLVRFIRVLIGDLDCIINCEIWVRGTYSLKRNKASAMLFKYFQVDVIGFSDKQPIPTVAGADMATDKRNPKPRKGRAMIGHSQIRAR
jgi:hypothetical protein